MLNAKRTILWISPWPLKRDQSDAMVSIKGITSHVTTGRTCVDQIQKFADSQCCQRYDKGYIIYCSS